MTCSALTQSIRRFARSHPLDQPLDMLDRRVRRDAMAEIEDMRPAAHRREDRVDAVVERLAAGDEAQRIEIALQRDRRWTSSRASVIGIVQSTATRVDAGPFGDSRRAARRRPAESR